MKKLFLTLALVASATPALAGEAGNKSDEAAKAFFANFDSTWSKHDGKAQAALFAEDAVLVSPDGTASKGRAELEKTMTTDFAGPLAQSQPHHTVAWTRSVDATHILVDLDATFDGLKLPEGQPAPRFHAVGLLVKQGGKWLLQDARPYMLAPAKPAGGG